MPSYGGDVMRRSIELAIQATGTQALDDVAAKIKYNSDVIQVLSEQYKQNVITADAYRAGVQRIVRENDRLQAGLDAVKQAQEKADYEARKAAGALTVEELALEELQAQAVSTADAMDRLAAAKGRANASTGALGRGVLDLSRAIEDVATGGPIGGLNNLGGIVGNFGSAAGLASSAINPLVAGVTALGTGAYLLYRNWDTLVGAFGSGRVETEAQEFERLSKAVAKTTGELLRLNELEDKRREKSKDESTIQGLRDKKGPDAIAVGKFVDDSIGRAGGLDKLLAGLADVAVRVERNTNANATPDSLAALRKRMASTDPEISPLAKQFADAAQGSRADLAGIVALARNATNRAAVGDGFVPSPFVTEFADLYAREGPEAQRQKAALQARLKAAADEAKAKADAEKEARDRDNAKVDELNAQGQAADAEVKRILDAQKAARAEAERQAREAAKNIKADGKVADANAKAAAVGDLKQRFQQAGFSDQFAAHGATIAQQRIAKGEPEQVVLDRVYKQLLQQAALLERNHGITGEATQRLMAMEQRMNMIQQQQQQMIGQMQRGRNRKPTLLPHVAAR